MNVCIIKLLLQIIKHKSKKIKQKNLFWWVGGRVGGNQSLPKGLILTVQKFLPHLDLNLKSLGPQTATPTNDELCCFPFKHKM